MPTKTKQENKNQPIGDKDKKLIRMWEVYFECVLPFTIHIHDRSGNFEWLWY